LGQSLGKRGGFGAGGGQFLSNKVGKGELWVKKRGVRVKRGDKNPEKKERKSKKRSRQEGGGITRESWAQSQTGVQRVLGKVNLRGGKKMEGEAPQKRPKRDGFFPKKKKHLSKLENLKGGIKGGES